jgi:hypothetical protein
MMPNVFETSTSTPYESPKPGESTIVISSCSPFSFSNINVIGFMWRVIDRFAELEIKVFNYSGIGWA